jgi:hypothetical protein
MEGNEGEGAGVGGHLDSKVSQNTVGNVFLEGEWSTQDEDWE